MKLPRGAKLLAATFIFNLEDVEIQRFSKFMSTTSTPNETNFFHCWVSNKHLLIQQPVGPHSLM